MNLYSDVTFTHYDLTSSSGNDVIYPPSALTPPPIPAPFPTTQPAEHHQNPYQTDQSELCNSHANPVSSATVNDQPAHHPTLVQSESLNITENANYFLSTDPVDQSDVSSPPRLSIVSSQSPDLECSICFSQFNNAFRCPKMLQCGHTFCLECLARMNVKSPEPSALLCPLCRAFTPLPTLGLPRLSNDTSVLSCLPSSMQRVYSVRFVRNKGRLQLKRLEAQTWIESWFLSCGTDRFSPWVHPESVLV
uniref:RING-type domain-containing protein n=1 Tax=Periophthalmus magnuspinnatus TaxID=409849 RepID=A0A3B3ZKQ8_9GOBI